MIKCAKTGKILRFYHKKYYIYPGKIKGSMEITDEQIISKEALDNLYPLKNNHEEGKTKVVIFSIEKKFKEALNELERYFDERNPADWYTKGNIFTNLKRIKEAIKCYDECLFLDTHYIKAWYRKGWRFFGEGDYEKAVLCFENVIKLEESKNKKERMIRDDWLISAMFSCMISLILINNKLIEKGKPSEKISKRAHDLINEFYPYFTCPVLLQKDKIVSFNLWHLNETQFVDYCLQNIDKILDIFEPPLIAEFISFGDKH